MKPIFVIGFSFFLLVSNSLYAQDAVGSIKDDAEKSKAIILEYFEQGLYKKAIYGFSDLIKENPKDYELYGKRGIAFLWNGQPTLALADLNLAIEKEPEPIYYFYRASLREYNDIQGKIADYDRAIALDGSKARYYYDRASLKLRAFREYVYNKPQDERLKLKALEKKIGFSLSICKDFEKAASLNDEYSSKVALHCEAYKDLAYYHVKN